jgi:hypothetical protein
MSKFMGKNKIQIPWVERNFFPSIMFFLCLLLHMLISFFLQISFWLFNHFCFNLTNVVDM